MWRADQKVSLLLFPVLVKRLENLLTQKQMLMQVGINIHFLTFHKKEEKNHYKLFSDSFIWEVIMKFMRKGHLKYQVSTCTIGPTATSIPILIWLPILIQQN